MNTPWGGIGFISKGLVFPPSRICRETRLQSGYIAPCRTDMAIYLRKTFHSIIFILLISGVGTKAHTGATTAEGNDIFEHLNLDYQGLEGVKAALARRDTAAAEHALLDYFQTRTNRRLEWAGFPGDIGEADQYAANIFEFRSYRHDFGQKIDWTLKAEDSEWNFSLNRFRWFASFMAAHQKTGDDKYPRAWVNQISDWFGQCEPGHPRTIDTGRRLESWVKSYDYFIIQSKSPVITPEFHALMLESMRQQAEFLLQPEHWRRYSNWGTFECSGLALFTLMFPEFKRNEIWLHEVWYRMRTQLQESYHADGMHIEVSPSYHSHEMEVWFNFIRMAEMNGVDSPLRPQLTLQPLQELFDAPAEALMYFYKPTGVMPQVGDTDERDERYLLRQLGAYWNKPALTYVATSGKEGTPPARVSAAFPKGGYFIMRSGWGQESLPYSDEFYLLFDVGTNQPWHAHFDMLIIVMTAYGQEILIDPGRYTYTSGVERDYFKSTRAHNTIVIDGEDQPRYYTPEPAFWQSMAGFDYVVGTQSSNPEVTHTRSVLFVKPTYWIVVDRIAGEGRHQYDQYWHLSEVSAGEVQLLEKGRRIIAPHLVMITAGDKNFISNDGVGPVCIFLRRRGESSHIRPGFGFCQEHGAGPFRCVKIFKEQVFQVFGSENLNHFACAMAHINISAQGIISTDKILRHGNGY